MLGHGASRVAQTVKNLPAVQETGVQSLGPEDPLEKRMAAHFRTMGSSTGQSLDSSMDRACWARVRGVATSWTRLSDQHASTHTHTHTHTHTRQRCFQFFKEAPCCSPQWLHQFSFLTVVNVTLNQVPEAVYSLHKSRPRAVTHLSSLWTEDTSVEGPAE